MMCVFFKHLYQDKFGCLYWHLIILNDFSSLAGCLTVSSVAWWTTVKILLSVPAHIYLSTQHMQRQEVLLYSMRHSMLQASFVSQVSTGLKHF